MIRISFVVLLLLVTSCSTAPPQDTDIERNAFEGSTQAPYDGEKQPPLFMSIVAFTAYQPINEKNDVPKLRGKTWYGWIPNLHDPTRENAQLRAEKSRISEKEYPGDDGWIVQFWDEPVHPNDLWAACHGEPMYVYGVLLVKHDADDLGEVKRVAWAHSYLMIPDRTAARQSADSNIVAALAKFPKGEQWSIQGQ
jgi:hypothetical protein